MKVPDYAKHILLSPSLSDKLLPPPRDLDWQISGPSLRISRPARESSIAFSDCKDKMPRLEHLNLNENKGITLHHFANHELMAIELFAWALLAFPEAPLSIRKDWLQTLVEEQKHLRLYLRRMLDFGIALGDRPLNYLFWKQIPNLQTPEQFAAVLSISFEGANLDFMQIYAKAFAYFQDFDTAALLLQVYLDEVKHVNRGWQALHMHKPKVSEDWDFYLNQLVFPFTPRRAKAYHFIPDTRLESGISPTFCEKLSEYSDEYSHSKNAQIIKRLPIHWDQVLGKEDCRQWKQLARSRRIQSQKELQSALAC